MKGARKKAAKKRTKKTAAKTRQAGAGQPRAGQPALSAARDTDLQIFDTASSTVTEIDRRYRLANINDQIKLKPKRDEAFAAFSLARLKLLELGVVTTAEELVEMRALKSAVDQAAVTQDLVIAAARVAIFLAKTALK
jgi:hypothetical protein